MMRKKSMAPEDVFGEHQDPGLFAEEPDIALSFPGEGACATETAGGESTPWAEISVEVLDSYCRERLCPVCPSRKEAEEERLRALADLDNARKRLAREKEDYARYAAESLLVDILQALDTFDLALAHAPEDPACGNFVVGVEMTRKLLLEALARHGLAQVGAAGDVFNPTIHEAISLEANPEYVSGQVCALQRKGYKLRDRLLRPAQVVVCKNEA